MNPKFGDEDFSLDQYGEVLEMIGKIQDNLLSGKFNMEKTRSALQGIINGTYPLPSQIEDVFGNSKGLEYDLANLTRLAESADLIKLMWRYANGLSIINRGDFILFLRQREFADIIATMKNEPLIL